MVKKSRLRAETIRDRMNKYAKDVRERNAKPKSRRSSKKKPEIITNVIDLVIEADGGDDGTQQLHKSPIVLDVSAQQPRHGAAYKYPSSNFSEQSSIIDDVFYDSSAVVSPKSSISYTIVRNQPDNVSVSSDASIFNVSSSGSSILPSSVPHQNPENQPAEKVIAISNDNTENTLKLPVNGPAQIEEHQTPVDSDKASEILSNRSQYYFLEKRSDEIIKSHSSNDSSILNADDIRKANENAKNRSKVKSSSTRQKLIALRTFADNYDNFNSIIERIVSVDCSPAPARVYILREIHTRNDLRKFQSTFKQSKFFIVNDSKNQAAAVEVQRVAPVDQLHKSHEINQTAAETFKVSKLDASSLESHGSVHLDIVDLPAKNMYNVLRHE